MKNKVKKNKYTSVFHFVYWKPWYRIDWHCKSIFRIIKWSWQRITKGYCDYDRYDIDHWFLDVVPSMLEEYANKTYGFPLWCEKKVPENDVDAAYELWQSTVRDIAKHLRNGSESALDDFYEQYDTYEFPLEKHKEVVAKRREELNKGLELFKEHFEDLWD